MCSINGFNFKNEDLVLKMNKVTSHRGPDGSGFFCDDNISLGHNRLSIIDLSEAASQPMSNDGKLVIVFNGEIYNFRELKNELMDYPFKTNSDTEVILAAYQKWGKDCVKRFNGIFAFAIWDKDKKELFLAKDNIGIKPLYYHWDGNHFVFSSEIKAILEHNLPRILDIEALNHYLRVLYVPEPRTMFNGIKKFPAGHIGLLNGKKFITERYWRLQEEGDYLKGSLKETAKIVYEEVEKAVARQLVSDKPLGLYLSGGIDSSAVLHCASRHKKNIDTFSVGFDLAEKEQRDKFNADFYLARRTAKHYGTNHNEVLLSPQNILDNLEKCVWHMDEPISNPTALSMMKLAGFAKQKADVVLGGDGGDELFGGDDRYRLSLAAGYYQKLPNRLRNILSRGGRLQKLNTPAGIDRFALFMFQKDVLLKETINNNFLKFDTKNFFQEKFFSQKNKRSFEEQFMDTDLRSWLADESLMMTDKMSMASGLEIRVPLLDNELVKLAARIPIKHKISLGKTKIVLKEAFRGKIPSFLFDQPKRGWFSPAAKWLRRKELQIKAREILSSSYYNETSLIFNWENIEKILDGHLSGEKYNLNILWSILTFQIWAKMYKIKL